MIRKLLRDESGYSLVEVMASILILTAAIIPMVTMFDMGLTAATRGGNYDKARAIANDTMENVKALPYNRPSTAASDSAVESFAPGANRTCPGSIESGFTCTVRTRFANANLTTFQDSPQTQQMQVVVTVSWNGNAGEIRTTGLVSGGRS